MDRVLNELERLQLDYLEDAWVDAIYCSDYLEFGEVPPDYASVLETINISYIFNNAIKHINIWLEQETETPDEKTWTALSHRVPYRKVLAILGYHIDSGIKNVVIREMRNNALLASRLYFKFLSIPGYSAYQIYHSQLFANSLACLGFPKMMCDKEDYFRDSKELGQEVNWLIKELSKFVLDLRGIMEHLQLGPSDMNFEDIMSNLVDITGGAIVNKLNVDTLELGNISRVIYQMIDIMICDSDQVANPEAIQILFKCLLLKLVAAAMETRNANNIIRASYVTYSGLILSKYGRSALNGYTVLLEHLCYNYDGLEKAEVRSARVSMVIGLMSLLPSKTYRRIVIWVLKLSETARVAHRQVAVELLAKFLANEPEEQIETNINQNPSSQNNDSGNGEQLNETNNTGTDENGTPTNGNNGQPNSDEDSQDSLSTLHLEQDMSPEEAAAVLRARSHTVPHGAVLRALYERAHDTSAGLRARALQLLALCVLSDRPAMRRAVKELCGSGCVSRVVALCARAACDDRALVRRAAAALLHQLLTAAVTPDPPSNTDLAVLIGLCRDASLIVRSAAITGLGELVLDRPFEATVDAFLCGPVHQLSDPETKVQDLVISYMQQFVIDRVKKYSEHVCYDSLPWMFLSGITKRNMRRHLQKACAMLSKKNNSVSVRLVDVLSTHLGTGCNTRDLEVLVILTSIARHVDYHNIEFVIDYYYQLINDDTVQPRDTRLMSLTLELLSMWSRFANNEQRTVLRERIVQRLASSADDGCRIAAANLAAQLDPTDLQWANELMQLSEARAVRGACVAEWVRAADLSLVAPAPASSALLDTFLAALTHPPADGSPKWWGECVAGASRLCVRSRPAATIVAPALAALLHANVPHTARVNSVYALTDICIRYTCIVEPLLKTVCGCVERTAPPPLRRAAARSLTRLLLAGYLRLRTPLYFKYWALLADDDHDVREPAEYYVTCCLTAESIFYHFVDCVLYYNKEDSDIDIKFDEKQLIYDVMLQRLSTIQRLNMQCRLAREILEHAANIVDDGDELTPALNAALLDTIALLVGPRFKLPPKNKTGEAADLDEIQERVTANLVSHKMKRTVAEVLVPAVLRLYARLGAGGGQLAAYLVSIANDLLRDYRQEIEELIENDEELVQRIQQFQETIGSEPSFGNARNLVTSSNVAEPETPRAPRRRAPRAARETPRKRALRM